MRLDLWKFDERSLKKMSEELPNSILRGQADILSEKTGGVIYGKTTNMKFHSQDKTVEYELATAFEIVVPQLDNYNYTLLIVYSKPEKDYPVAITVGSNIMDDAQKFRPAYVCENKEEFISALKEILSSEEINRNIGILYSKASF